MVIHRRLFKTRKKDNQAFPVSDPSPKSAVEPSLVQNPNGIGDKFKRFQERRDAGKKAALEQKTAEQERKTVEVEKKLGRQLVLETERSRRRQRLAEAQENLAKVQQREKETKRQLEKFTLKGKIKRRFVEGSRRRSRVLAQKKEARRAFLATPEGRIAIEEARRRRQVALGVAKKGVGVVGRAVFGKPKRRRVVRTRRARVKRRRVARRRRTSKRPVTITFSG